MLRRLITALLLATATACAPTAEVAPVAQDSPAPSASPADPSPTGTVDSTSNGDPERQTESGAPKPEPDRGTVWCAEDEAVNDHGDFVCVEWFVVDEVADIDHRFDPMDLTSIILTWNADCVSPNGGGQVNDWCPGLTSGSLEAWTAEDLRALARVHDLAAKADRGRGDLESAEHMDERARLYRRFADDVDAGRRPAPTV